MKEIVVPSFINGRPSMQKLYIGDGCKDDVSPIRSQEAYFSSKGITLSPDVVKSIISLHKLALEKGVSFEELTVLAYVVANKQLRAGSDAEGSGGDKPAA
jgi:hypothetical protein